MNSNNSNDSNQLNNTSNNPNLNLNSNRNNNLNSNRNNIPNNMDNMDNINIKKVHKLDTYLSTKRINNDCKKFKRYGCDLKLEDDIYLNSPVYGIGNDVSKVNEFNENIKKTYNKHHNLVKSLEEDIEIFDTYENISYLQD